jgi:hypothetical protein
MAAKAATASVATNVLRDFIVIDDPYRSTHSYDRYRELV